jgi:hypothetical protein
MPTTRVLAGAAALALLVPSPARADLVRIIDGKTIEGKATLSSKKWTVKLWKGKSVTFAESEVKFVEKGECSWEAAARMAKEIPADASDALYVEKHLEIARYLKDRRQYSADMAELEMKEYEAVLKKAPEHDEARTGLGHVKWGQWWFKNEKERDSFRKGAPPAQMEPLGFQKYKKTGMWESKEDVEAMDAGKVKYKGKWLTEDEKKAAQGYVKDDKGAWVLARDLQARKTTEEVEKQLGKKPETVTSSTHFLIVSWLNAGETAGLKALFEKTYEEHRRTLGVPVPKEEDGEDDMFPEPITVYMLVDGDLKDKWVDTYGKGQGWNDAQVEFYKKGGGWHSMSPAPYMLSSGKKAEKNRARDTDGDLEVARSNHTSQIGRLILDRLRGGGQPAWLMEGNAFLAEIRANESAECCYVGMTQYREQTPPKEGSKAKYFDYMKKQLGSSLDRPFRQLLTLELNYLDWSDAVKSWSLLEFLAATNPAALNKLVTLPMGDVEEILPAHVDAAIKAMVPKDPAAAPIKKDEGAPPTAPIKVRGPGAMAVSPGSKEERAVNGARGEALLLAATGKDIEVLEAEWKAWILKK